MKHSERSAKMLFQRFGLFVTLRAFFGSKGSSAAAPTYDPSVGVAQPDLVAKKGGSPRRSILPVATGYVIVAIGLLLPATSAVAFGGPPGLPGSNSDCEPTHGLEITHTSVRNFLICVFTENLNTTWRLENAPAEAGHAPAENSPAWVAVPGGSGSFPADMKPVIPDNVTAGELTGLSPETTYYVRLTAENSAGKATPSLVESFETLSLRPRIPSQVNVSNITGTSAQVAGYVVPEFETHWHFEIATSESGPWTPAPGAEGTITAAEAGEEGHAVEGEIIDLKPGTTYYVRLFAKNEHGNEISHLYNGRDKPIPGAPSFETAGPPAVVTFAVHGLDSQGVRALGSVRPDGLDTHYRFEYVSQRHFEEQGFTAANATPEVDVGSGDLTANGFPTSPVGEDLPGLQAGATYRYRIVATNEAAPQGVRGAEQTLTVPLAPEPGLVESCPNEALRNGSSAALPDCRAYEQVTPSEKEGAMDIDTAVGITDEFRVGEDGEHFMLHAPGTQWGDSPNAKESNYFFTRTSEGWQMTSVSPQPQAGVDDYAPILFNRDLTEAAFEIGWLNTPIARSEAVELAVGSSGGPYATVARIPRNYVTSEPSLAAASPNLDKVIISTEDRDFLPGEPSTTKHGNDLYEYSEGQVHQINVLLGAPIGSCGASTVLGHEGLAVRTRDAGERPTSSAHSVSENGSRVFFYAGFGHECPDEGELESGRGTHLNLYERLNGVETVDIGEYTFLAANPEGTSLLLEHVNGTSHEVFLYDTETQTAKHLFTVPTTFSSRVSEDLSTIYLETSAQLNSEAPPVEGSRGENTYSFNVASKTFQFLPLSFAEVTSVSREGRYLTFESFGFPGVPGGRPETEEELKAREGYNGGYEEGRQIYRYDSIEKTVECVSCASPFNPEPRLNSSAIYAIYGWDGTPNQWFASENGDFVFFETPAALVSQDVDGEIAPEDFSGGNPDEQRRSRSSDVYEWRRVGIDGCTHMQGCLALISGGKGGGYLTELLGTTPSGDDVFFATHESLVPTDKDRAGDVYDARVDGGFAPPAPPPVECEGDACSTPFAAPSEITPSSATFQGAGDITLSGPVAGKRVKTVSKKPKPKNSKKDRKKKRMAKKKVKGKTGGKRTVHSRNRGVK